MPRKRVTRAPAGLIEARIERHAPISPPEDWSTFMEDIVAGADDEAASMLRAAGTYPSAWADASCGRCGQFLCRITDDTLSESGTMAGWWFDGQVWRSTAYHRARAARAREIVRTEPRETTRELRQKLARGAFSRPPYSHPPPTPEALRGRLRPGMDLPQIVHPSVIAQSQAAEADNRNRLPGRVECPQCGAINNVRQVPLAERHGVE